MGVASLRQHVRRLEALAQQRRQLDTTTLDAIRADPTMLMKRAGMTPDEWQEQVLRSDHQRFLLLCARQRGKSTVSAALALKTALLRPRSPVLLLSPSERQSGELFRKVLDLFGALGRPMGVVAESALRIEFANGSRVLSLPGTESTVRGFSGVGMLIIDEAARVLDPLYYAVRPMLAVSKGSLVALSTPFGQRGWFYNEWQSTENWERVRITAEGCPRITPEFLAEERRSLGDRWFRQEYLCEFEASSDAVFDPDDIRKALCDDVQPLFAGRSFP